MLTKNVLFLLFKFSMLFLSIPSIFGQLNDRAGFDTQIQYEVIENKVNQLKSKARYRKLYIYIKVNDFSEDSILGIVKSIEKNYCDPYSLSITFFNDKQMLEKQLKGDKTPQMIEYSNSLEGLIAADEEYKKHYPPMTGYLRINYSRRKNFEFFRYSPDISSPELKTIELYDAANFVKADGYYSMYRSECEIKE